MPNRNAIHQQISLALERSERDETGVVYLDLDNFKKVNDAYGHMFGDQLLQAVLTGRFLAVWGKDQTLGRLGGDEFVVLAEHTSQAALEAMSSRILERLRQPFRIGLIEVYSGLLYRDSAFAPLHGEDRESLIRNADTAMYHAKENGRGQVLCLRGRDEPAGL
ncbi:Cyclic di-GMP phosphodiesterase Gmr [Pantoea agglomerans]|uniref:Cyclic di-GMP phosphodiesterase Gmr n=1 Tax=Enterobacter agglomerans TaxID=549 RepID=A0A379AGD5_ENTAG|nr:Cyclic di-GMP phosphodiesterase Gmr [Pantoea agglomerans]